MSIEKTKEAIKLSVDTGSANTKYGYFKENEIQAGIFPTNIAKIHENDTMVEGLRVTYKGEHYLFSKRNLPNLKTNNSKLTDTHYIAVYTAIAKALNCLELDSNQSHSIDLSINIPIVDFKKQDVKTKYINQYQNQTVNIIVDGKEFSFYIEKVTPYFESQGCLLRDLDSYAEEIVNVIDLGGRNDSRSRFINLRPQGAASESGTLGALKTLELIAERLSDSGQEYTIEDVIDFKTGVRKLKPEGFQEIFDYHVEQYLQKLHNKLISNGVNYSLEKFVITGGGAILFRENIKDFFSTNERRITHLKINSTDGWADNVKGAVRRSINVND